MISDFFSLFFYFTNFHFYFRFLDQQELKRSKNMCRSSYLVLEKFVENLLKTSVDTLTTIC